MSGLHREGCGLPLPALEAPKVDVLKDLPPPTQVRVTVNRTVVLEEPVGQLRALWEETSFQLDRLQAKPHCVAQEEQGLRERAGPTYCLPPTFPRASVPCEPGEGVCVEAWLPWHCGPWGRA